MSNFLTIQVTALTEAEIQALIDASLTGKINMVSRGDPTAFDFAVASFTQDNSPHDLDLSSIIPVNARFAQLYVEVKHTIASGQSTLFRPKGNSNYFNIHKFTPVNVSEFIAYSFIIPLNSNRFIQYLCSDANFSVINLVVLGWLI